MLFAVTVPYMATATATRGGKGPKGKGTKPAPPAAKKPKRKPKGQGARKQNTLALISSAKAENPQLTSDQFAVKFNLPVDEVARHKMFILQYTLDYNIKAAALRMGYPADTAFDTGKLMLYYPYAQMFLAECQRNAEFSSIMSASQLLHKCLEEMNRPDTVKDGCAMTNSTTRLGWAKLAAQMMGCLNPIKAPETPTLRKVMHVGDAPAGGDVDQWGKTAQASQKALQRSTAIDV